MSHFAASNPRARCAPKTRETRAKQTALGRELKRAFEPLTRQAVSDELVDLLRAADRIANDSRGEET